MKNNKPTRILVLLTSTILLSAGMSGCASSNPKPSAPALTVNSYKPTTPSKPKRIKLSLNHIASSDLIDRSSATAQERLEWANRQVVYSKESATLHEAADVYGNLLSDPLVDHTDIETEMALAVMSIQVGVMSSNKDAVKAGLYVYESKSSLAPFIRRGEKETYALGRRFLGYNTNDLAKDIHPDIGSLVSDSTRFEQNLK